LGDEIMLGHVFSNLLSNAFKYSKDAPAPKTVVRYSVEAIEIDVIDYGIGVPEQDQKHLFDSFYRASNVSTIVGSGLGLPIVKEFVEKHNGVVRIQSKENQGTTVTIVLRK
jgi:signal transduction histidine kinase